MPVRTKRWSDPIDADDGLRVLICRYRPRGVPSAAEPWDAWTTALAPSKALHAAAYGKHGTAQLPFAEYERRFRAEMAAAQFWVDGFAKRLRDGETITLLCSSACTDETRCHRSIVRRLLEESAQAVDALTTSSSRPLVRRRP